MIRESFHSVSYFFVFGYLQVFLRKVIASASSDAFAESSVPMKQAMVLSGMSHVMVKLFAPWVSWKVLPCSGRIALLFVLHTVAFLIITCITVCWRCFFSSRQRKGRKYVSFSRNFLWRSRRYQFRGRRWLGCRTRCPLSLRFVFRSYSMWIALENEIGFEITGITKLFHVPSPQPLIISWTNWFFQGLNGKLGKLGKKGDSLT